MGRKPKFEKGMSKAWNAREMEVNATEQEVLLVAMQLGRFSATQVCEYLKDFKSRPSVERALKNLTDQKFFARYRPLMNPGEGSHPYVYQMTSKGKRKGILYFYNGTPDLKYDYKVPKGRTVQLRHRLEANDVFLRILGADNKVKENERIGLGLTSSRVANNAVERIFVRENENGHPEYIKIRPDAFLSYDTRYRHVRDHDAAGRYSGMPISMYLEVDLGTEKISQIRRKMNLYIGMYYLAYWRGEAAYFPLVVWVFKKQKRAQELLDLLERFYENPRLVEVLTTSRTRREIDETQDVPNFFMAVTTEDLFYKAGSATQGKIWRLPGSTRPYSLEELFEKRGKAAVETKNEKNRFEEMLTRMRARAAAEQEETRRDNE